MDVIFDESLLSDLVWTMIKTPHAFPSLTSSGSGREAFKEYLVNASVTQGSTLGPTLFLQYSNGLPDDVICNIAISAEDTTLYSKRDLVSDLWQRSCLIWLV